MSWLTRYRHRRQERRLLSQWRAQSRQETLIQLPLTLLLWQQSRSLADSLEAGRAKTASYLAAPRLSPPIERRSDCGKIAIAPAWRRKTLQFYQQRCRPALVRFSRRVLIRLACLLLTALRLSRGIRPR